MPTYQLAPVQMPAPREKIAALQAPVDVSLYAVGDPAPRQKIVALPAGVDLFLYAGDDFYLELTVTDAAGDPLNLSTATAKAQIRTNPGDATPLCTFEVTIAGSVILLHLPSVESTKLVDPCVWDCQIATPEITTLAAGNVSVTAEVTR